MSWHPLRRVLATVVLLAWTCGLVAPLAAGGHEEIDSACGETVWATPHHSRAQFERVLPPLHDDHCALCHLQRTLRDMSGVAGVVVSDSSRTRAYLPHDLVYVPAAERPGVPSRAPPSVLN